MKIFIKKKLTKTTKAFIIAFFAIIMFVNVKISLNPSSDGNIDLMGLKMSLSIPSAYATGNCNLPCFYSGWYNDCVVFHDGPYCLLTYGCPAEIHCHYMQ